MTFIAEVRLSHPDLALSQTIDAVQDVRVEREHRASLDSDRHYVFYSVYGAGFDAYEDAMEADPTVADPLVVASADDRRLYRIRLTDRAVTVDAKLASLGIAVLEAASAAGDWQFVLWLPDREQLAAFNSYCEERGVSFHVDSLATHEDEMSQVQVPSLTDAQEEALVTAYRRDYFDEPRGTSLEELAAELGISSTAVGGRLRRGTGKIVDAVLLDDETDGDQ